MYHEELLGERRWLSNSKAAAASVQAQAQAPWWMKKKGHLVVYLNVLLDVSKSMG